MRVPHRYARELNADQWITLRDNAFASGTLLENFNVIGEWSMRAGANPIDNQTEFIEGGHSLKVGDGVQVTRSQKTISMNFGGVAPDLTIWAYHTAERASPAKSTSTRRSGPPTTRRRSPRRARFRDRRHGTGLWHRHRVAAGDWTPTGVIDWNATMVLLVLAVKAADNVISYDAMYQNYKAHPLICPSHDDVHNSVFTYLNIYRAADGFAPSSPATTTWPHPRRPTWHGLPPRHSTNWAG